MDKSGTGYKIHISFYLIPYKFLTAVLWGEEEYYHPSEQFIAHANMTDPKVFERFSLENFPNYADLLSWYEYWHTTLDTSDAPCWKSFVGGRVNASYNCIDRHLAKNKNKTAIHFVPELEEERTDHNKITAFIPVLWTGMNAVRGERGMQIPSFSFLMPRLVGGVIHY